MPVRRTAFGLWLCLMFLTPAGASAQTRVTPEVREWLSALVAKVATAVEVTRPTPGKRRPVVVEVRVVVAADGTLRDVSVERGSGSRRTDESALAAVMAAAPFGPPPKELLARDGTADLSFPMELAHRR
ncbi:TonB family protein [Methylobacterium sp. J-090]|uniref:TonB family protein n=1 Tax=Methylobacterium sp. J-090 TaxID=2836666 RepID=UPI001FB9A569|nr:TonB family protein [Methylobacterium sp. J-090]MCJ2081830.1 TonB family protein [Methylobacterium sp. J-090]